MDINWTQLICEYMYIFKEYTQYLPFAYLKSSDFLEFLETAGFAYLSLLVRIG